MKLVPRYSRTTIGTACLTSFISLLSSFFMLAEAQTFKPPKTQLRRHNPGLGVRCGYKSTLTFKAPSTLKPPQTESGMYINRADEGSFRCGGYYPPIRLTALIPESNSGLTTAAYPTFFFYVPYSKSVSGEFFLVDDKGNEVYQTPVPIKKTEGIVSVSLPSNSNLPPLEVGKFYSWDFYLVFDSEEPSMTPSTSGWITRVQVKSDVNRELNNASAVAKPAIYAANGIWHDSLTSLAKLRCEDPKDLTLASKWRSLIDQIGLPKISKKPLLECNALLNK